MKYLASKNENNLPAFLFHQGTNYFAYKYLGLHFIGNKAVARVWAPNASSVSLVGDFNGWNAESHKMKRKTEMGIYEISVDRALLPEGSLYKFAVTHNGKTVLKADPYALSSETLDKTASVVTRLPSYKWGDARWLTHRKKTVKVTENEKYAAPINIYEMHLASWKTRDGRSNVSGDAYLNYREIADELVPYVKMMGYTHVELMPITEYPYDASWGYQVCSYFAPTSRFGTPEDFMYFVDTLHKNGIGVILDWVPAHFPKDEHGLYEFDGTRLYEYQGNDRIENKGWGTRYFDVARNEVQCFLISSALFWLEKYHVDGLRVDAVASMLYLDYDKMPGEWVPNVYGDNKNLEAIAFFQKLNSEIFARHPDVLMIAEESTDWQKITAPVSEGGLGFNFKWNMGFANDMYSYVEVDPFFRKYHHSKLNFSMMYSFNENYILPVSHDEVVHGKLSLIDKMHGSYEDKFRGFRLFMAHLMAHPGKKLTFMGCEYGQFREWDYENQLEWFMLDYETHRNLQKYTAALNNFYLQTEPLWYDDFSWDGFRWVIADEAERNLLGYERIGKNGERVLCLFNFSGTDVDNYYFTLPDFTEKPINSTRQKNTSTVWKCVFFTEDKQLGGNGETPRDLVFENQTACLKLPKLSAAYFIPGSTDDVEI